MSNEQRTEAHALIDGLKKKQLGVAVEFLARLAGGHDRDWGPLGTVLGIEDAGRAEGGSSCSVVLKDIHANPVGLAHGCASFALVDFGMGYALQTVIPAEQWCTSQEVSIRFLRPVRRTRLLCRSRVVDIRGDVARARAEIVNGSGKAVAEATGVYRLFESGRRSFKPRLEPQL